MLQKLKRWFGYFYKVPWCVPAWGWPEMKVTVQCIFRNKIINGPYPSLFENTVKQYIGLSYAIAVNRGRTAIELALCGFELEELDEVILPSYVCKEVLEAVVRVGAKPIFADIASDLHMTVESIRAAITPKTKCVIVAHLFGKAAPIDEIEKFLEGMNIYLIDDAAQSFGAKLRGRLLGTFGDCGIVSCGPGKALAGSGGGLLVTNNSNLYKRASQKKLLHENKTQVLRRVILFWLWRRFRCYTLPFKIIIERVLGSIEIYPAKELYKMSNIEAAIGLEQFYSLKKNVKQRKENGQQVIRALGGLAKYSVSDLSHDSMFLKLILTIPDQVFSVGNFINVLATAGIECQSGYTPCHHTYNNKIVVPNTDSVWKNVVCVPVDTKVNKSILFSIERAVLANKL